MSRKHKIPGIFATSLTRYQTMSGQSLSKFAASLYYILRCVVASCPDSLCAYLMTEILYPYVSLKRRPTKVPQKAWVQHTFSLHRGTIASDYLSDALCAPRPFCRWGPAFLSIQSRFAIKVFQELCGLEGKNTSIVVSSWS